MSKKFMFLRRPTVKQVKDKAEAALNRTLGPLLDKKDLPGQVKYGRRMLRTSEKFMPIAMAQSMMRKELMDGISKEMWEKKRKGIPDAMNLAYYTSCPEFMAFWAELGLGGDHLEAMLNPPDKVEVN